MIPSVWVTRNAGTRVQNGAFLAAIMIGVPAPRPRAIRAVLLGLDGTSLSVNMCGLDRSLLPAPAFVRLPVDLWEVGCVLAPAHVGVVPRHGLVVRRSIDFPDESSSRPEEIARAVSLLTRQAER